MGGPGGEGRLAGGEVGDQGRDLLGRAQPAHGLPRDEVLLGSQRVLALINAALPGGRLHSAGTDGIAANLNTTKWLTS